MTEMEKQRLKELLGESDEEHDGDDEGVSSSAVQQVNKYTGILSLVHVGLSPIQFLGRREGNTFIAWIQL